jgi:D-alanine-D-alanine ligase
VKGAFEFAAEFDDIVLAEEFIEGRELTIAVLGSGPGVRALPLIEIVAPAGYYDYQNKYFTDDTQYIVPAVLDSDKALEIQQMAVDAFNAIGCEGWARVDVMLRASDDKPFLLEINTSPGMTGHSLVPMAARALGQSYEELCLEILGSASLKIKRVAPPNAKAAQSPQGRDLE